MSMIKGQNPNAYLIGNARSGTVTLDARNGTYQRCSLNGDTTFSMSSGIDGQTIALVIDYSGGNNITIDGSIHATDGLFDLLPMPLQAWRRYKLDFEFTGGMWQLTGISAPGLEWLD